MTEKLDRAVAIQRQYYTETAARYDDMHAHEGDDDIANSKLLHSLVRMVDAHTLLDVGAGTGRGIRLLLDAMPHLSVRGVEPVAAMTESPAVPPEVTLEIFAGVVELLDVRLMLCVMLGPLTTCVTVSEGGVAVSVTGGGTAAVGMRPIFPPTSVNHMASSGPAAM